MATMTYNPLTDEHPPSYDCSTSTPWGPAQYAYKYAPGIICYGTAGHGGFHLSPRLNAQVHAAWRDANGWYEEDCEWSIVALTFPAAFNVKLVEIADGCAKRWFPHEYERVTGNAVEIADSLVLQNEAFAAAHVNDYVSVAAWGSWADWVPAGKVGVCAKVGGREGQGAERYFLVDAERYEARGGVSYVIDLEADISTRGPK